MFFIYFFIHRNPPFVYISVFDGFRYNNNKSYCLKKLKSEIIINEFSTNFYKIGKKVKLLDRGKCVIIMQSRNERGFIAIAKMGDENED